MRNAERLVAKLALSVLLDNQVHLIDSKPLPVADPKSPYPQRGTPVLGKRSSWSKFPEATKGFSTMGMVFGFKLHVRKYFTLSLIVNFLVYSERD